MGFDIRNFRGPLVLTIVMFLGLGYWTWHAWRGGEQHLLGRESHRASGVAEILLRCLSALDRNGRLQQKEIEGVLSDILQASQYRFFLLEQDGRQILRIGDPPAALPSPSPEGGQFFAGMFLFSRKLQLPGGEAPPLMRHFPVGESAGTNPTGRETWMTLGCNAKGKRDYDKTIERLLIPFSIVFLLLIASATAWIMRIRNRLLIEQLKTERLRSAHLEDLGLAAAGLAHETKNPLGIISGIAQQIVHDPQIPEHSRMMIETIIDEVDKSASRLGNFMNFAKQRAFAATAFDAGELIAQIAEILKPEFDSAAVSLETDCPAMKIVADADMLRQILVNLLLNSLQASSAGGVVTVRMKRHGGRASLVVEDRGTGIPPHLLANIFKPYVTGRPYGHGLGLAIVKRFVEEHGWTVEADSRPDGGAVFKISGIVLSEEGRPRV